MLISVSGAVRSHKSLRSASSDSGGSEFATFDDETFLVYIKVLLSLFLSYSMTPVTVFVCKWSRVETD